MIGRKVSHYRILEKLGSGGMGVVYKAEDTELKRTVAIKFLPPSLTRDDAAKNRFIHEAQAASSLEHHNICTIHEIGRTEDDQLFVVMACYEGETLKSKIKDQRLKIKEAIDIAIQIARGLEKAHEKGIVHRDIKPANIFITNDGIVKIIDFGLAKLAGRTMLTKEGSTLGTISYMSPEQARGEAVNHRSDIWSLGVVLYEMLAGEPPFKGEYDQAVFYSIMNEDPLPLKKINPAVSPEVKHITNRALKKNPKLRYSSIEDMLRDLNQYQDNLRASEREEVNLRTFIHRISKPKIAIPAIGVLIFLLTVSIWFFNRQAKIRWAKEEALPEIERLIKAAWWDYTDAYELAEKAERYIPNNTKLAHLFLNCSFHISIKTEPSGAKIFMKEYMAQNSKWEYLGVSPINNIRLPIGIFRWKMEMESYEKVLAAAPTWNVDIRHKVPLIPHDIMRRLDKKGSIPAGMVRVPAEQTPLGTLNDFFIDKYEVTNRQFKEFVDIGGYRNKEYWKHPFDKEGKILSWEEAMAQFVDQTGRRGPATWQAGDYPDDQEDYPVSGISWYEAAAYGEFVGKSLPTIYHWDLARGGSTPLILWPQIGGFAVFNPFSNFRGKGPVKVGSLCGITSYGAYDMAGNVQEWCWNKTPNGRSIRGGAWNDTPYMFGNLSQAPPFNRSETNGFRCALYPDPGKIPNTVFGMVELDKVKNYYKEKPVPDDIFQIYREQFAYDKTPLNARLEVRDSTYEDWVHERITFDAAYGDERIIAHLFLPTDIEPPYQTVIYFPGAGSAYRNSSEDLEHYYEFSVFLSFIVKNGRAVLYPVYKGTFERRKDDLTAIHSGKYSHRYSEYVIQLVQDFKRCVDYLETRKDINSKRLAYYGISWGGALGAIIPAVEDRLKVNVLIAGGFNKTTRPESDQINYISHVKTPTLILNGKYDTVFPYEKKVKPFFDLLGTPDEHKKLKIYETDHIPPKNEITKETLTWLDRYLGPVQ